MLRPQRTPATEVAQIAQMARETCICVFICFLPRTGVALADLQKPLTISEECHDR
jgi:uroporphyrinogen-III synthase